MISHGGGRRPISSTPQRCLLLLMCAFRHCRTVPVCRPAATAAQNYAGHRCALVTALCVNAGQDFKQERSREALNA